MTVLIDSNIWIEYFSGSEKGKKTLPFIEGKEKIVISTINLAEVLGQFLKTKTKEEGEKATTLMTDIAFVVPVSKEIALHAALLKKQYKWGLADAIIYSTALAHHATLITADSDFKAKENVHLV